MTDRIRSLSSGFMKRASAMGPHGLAQSCPERQDRDLRLGVGVGPPDDPALTHGQSADLRRQRRRLELVPEELVEALGAEAVAARVTDDTGLVVDGVRGLDHAHELDLVRRRHHNDVGQRPQVR
eukprot:756329-Hanusia_phi.AAC.1